MAEKQGKFAALAELHRQSPEPDAMRPVEERAPSPPAMALKAGKGRGRPPVGKRSNPEWKLYSHFIKRQTQRAAAARLQAEDNGRDLSDVLQELLEQWLKSEN